jgi:signal peptidase II
VSEQAPSTTAERQAEPTSEHNGRGRFRFDLLFFVIAITVLVVDQITKALVRHSLDRGEAWPNEDWFIKIINVSNSGAAFGILQGQTFFLVATSLVGVAAIVLYYMYPPMEHGALRIALALQLGGAAGNLSDRLRTGEVTDFIAFPHWPAFNVADSCISIGVVTILWFFLVFEGDRLRSPPPAGERDGSTAD